MSNKVLEFFQICVVYFPWYKATTIFIQDPKRSGVNL